MTDNSKGNEYEKEIGKKMTTCCDEPKLMFVHTITSKRIEIICEECGVSFWDWKTDCKHEVKIHE